jgi:hypothetical protein
MPSAHDLPDRDRDLLIVGVTPGLPFRVDETTIDGDFEDATPAGDERQLLHIGLELIEQLIGHAHGTVSITSNGAVFDADLHTARLADCVDVTERVSAQPQTAPDSAEPTRAAYFARAPVR